MQHSYHHSLLPSTSQQLRDIDFMVHILHRLKSPSVQQFEVITFLKLNVPHLPYQTYGAVMIVIMYTLGGSRRLASVPNLKVGTDK